MKTIKLPENVNTIITKLEEAGYEAYAVGGCVRDSLLDRTPEDWDITTSALPEQVKAVFRRTIDTGIQHGTVTVLLPKKPNHTPQNVIRDSASAPSQENTKTGSGFVGYEVTTYRIDGEYLDGRHPSEVTFTPSLHEDLARRDFTINAMAVNDRTGVVDDFGGLSDLRQHFIRAVGDPVQRFTEDALRMLRALRFSAQLDFSIDPATYDAVHLLASNLQHVSKERIAVELTKLLLSDHPMTISLVGDSGLSPYITEDFSKVPLDILLPDTLPKEKAVRWGALLRETPELSRKILRELKMDNDTIDTAEIIARLFHEPLPANGYELRKILSRVGYTIYENFLASRIAITDASDGITSQDFLHTLCEIQSSVAEVKASNECISLKDLAVSGKDLMEAGIPKGPKIGQILHTMLDEVLKNPSYNNKETLMMFLSDLQMEN
jgi:tRNA nucleotidyltransferase (CCA-adding enzyme)